MPDVPGVVTGSLDANTSGRAAPCTAPPAGIGGTGIAALAGRRDPDGGVVAYLRSGIRRDHAPTAAAKTPTMISDLRVSNSRSSRATRMVATATIQTSAIGINRFQPNAMNWS